MQLLEPKWDLEQPENPKGSCFYGGFSVVTALIQKNALPTQINLFEWILSLIMWPESLEIQSNKDMQKERLRNTGVLRAQTDPPTPYICRAIFLDAIINPNYIGGGASWAIQPKV